MSLLEHENKKLAWKALPLSNAYLYAEIRGVRPKRSYSFFVIVNIYQKYHTYGYIS